MDNVKPIFWHQGLFLQPQHFQLSDQYHRASLRPFQQYMQPHFWGVASLDLVRSALEHRLCEIEKGQFLFQDGTFVNLPNDAVVSPRSFEEAWVEADKPFTIYLGLKKFSHHEENVTVLNDFHDVAKVKTRYVSLADPDEVQDIYKGDRVAQVKTMRHVIQIIWETEVDKSEDYMLIPIARVLRDDAGVQYDASFFPPMVSISASDPLLRFTKEIRDDLMGRMMQLSSYDAPAEAADSAKQFDPTLMRYKLAARTLSTFIPRFFHYTESGEIHPWDLYGLLRELVGEVSTFTRTVNVLGETPDGQRLLPNYDHNNLGKCFDDAKSLLLKLLNEITIGPQFIVDMPFDGSMFATDIPQEFFTQNVDFYLIVSTKSDFEKHQQSLLTTAKVAARDTVEVLAERSLPGVGLMYIPTPPAEMPRRAESYYLKLDTHNDQWASVERQKTLALLWDEAADDAKIELVIVRR